jgi:hypothetical protein
MRIIGEGAETAEGVIFGIAGAAVPPAGVDFNAGTGGKPGTPPDKLDGGTGIPATGVMRRGTTAATPPINVAFGGGAAAAAIPAGGVRRRGTIGGGLCDPVPMSVLPELATPRGGGDDADAPRGIAGGGRDADAEGIGGGRDADADGSGGGPALARMLALPPAPFAAFASARARAASSITARAEAGSADVSVEWRSAAAGAVPDVSAGPAIAAGRGGTLGGDEDFGGALASPP